jgi:hypothetical protein
MVTLLLEAGVDLDAKKYSSVKGKSCYSLLSAHQIALQKGHFGITTLLRPPDVFAKVGSANANPKISIWPAVHRDLATQPPEIASTLTPALPPYIDPVKAIGHMAIESITSPSRLREIYEAIAVRDAALAERLMIRKAEAAGGLITHHATRFLVLAVKHGLVSTARMLLRSGVSPFQSISQTEEADLSQLDLAFGLESDENAFHMSTTPHCVAIANLLLQWQSETLRGEQNLLRHWRMCATWRFSLCSFDTLEHLLLEHMVDIREIDEALKPVHLKKITVLCTCAVYRLKTI